MFPLMDPDDLPPDDELDDQGRGASMCYTATSGTASTGSASSSSGVVSEQLQPTAVSSSSGVSNRRREAKFNRNPPDNLTH